MFLRQIVPRLWLCRMYAWDGSQMWASFLYGHFYVQTFPNVVIDKRSLHFIKEFHFSKICHYHIGLFATNATSSPCQGGALQYIDTELVVDEEFKESLEKQGLTVNYGDIVSYKFYGHRGKYGLPLNAKVFRLRKDIIIVCVCALLNFLTIHIYYMGSSSYQHIYKASQRYCTYFACYVDEQSQIQH